MRIEFKKLTFSSNHRFIKRIETTGVGYEEVIYSYGFDNIGRGVECLCHAIEDGRSTGTNTNASTGSGISSTIRNA